MSCRCIKTEADEKVQDFDEYDPYRADWTAPNSLHGSRYSLENARRPHDQYSTDDQSTTLGSMDSVRDAQQRQRQIPVQQQQPTRHGRRTPDSDDDYSDDDRHPSNNYRNNPRSPNYNQYAGHRY